MKRLIIVLMFCSAYGQNINPLESIVNTAIYTGGYVNQANLSSGWGMPIPMQVSVVRKDGVTQDLLHITTSDFGFSHSYTYSLPGTQITFENSPAPPHMGGAALHHRPLIPNENKYNNKRHIQNIWDIPKF